MAKKDKPRDVRLEDLDDTEQWRGDVLCLGGPASLMIADLIIWDARTLSPEQEYVQTPVAELAVRAHLSERTVRYRLDQLEAAQLLQREKGKGQGRGQAKKLKPTLPQETEIDPGRGCIAPARAGPQRNSRGLYRLRLTAV